MNFLLVALIAALAIVTLGLGILWLVGPWRPRSRHSGSSLGYAAMQTHEPTVWGAGTRRERH